MKDLFIQNYKNNLKVLKQAKSEIIEKISDFNIEEVPLIKTASGHCTYAYKIGNRQIYINSKYDPIKRAQDSLKEIEFKNYKHILVLGLGLGYQLKEVISKVLDLTKIIVIESNPLFIFISLNLHDFSKEIKNNKILFFSSGEDAWEKLPILERKDIAILNHPVLYGIFQETYSQALKKILEIRGKKEAILSKKNILLVNIFPYEAYRQLIMFLADAFLKMGHNVKIVGKEESKVRSEIINFVPDFIVSITFNVFLNELTRNLKLPYFCWEIDKIMNEEIFSQKYFSDYRYIFCVCLEDIEKFKKVGYKHVYYLPFVPNCSLQNRINAKDIKKYSHDICFVGSLLKNTGNSYSRFKNGLINGVKDMPKEKVKKVVKDIILLLEEVLAQQEKYSKENIYKLPEMIALLESQASMDMTKILGGRRDYLIGLLAKESCYRQRLSAVSSLYNFKVTVYGNKDWEEVSLKNIDYLGRIEFCHEAPKVFHLTKINLNITRIYNLDGLSDRVFNVLASKGFLMTNYAPVIDNHFKNGEELVCFRSNEELVDLCKYYLKHESQRKAIAEKGYQRILKDHTMEKRAEFMLEKLNE